MMFKIFQQHHRAFAPDYALGLQLLAEGKWDPREPKVLGDGDPELFMTMASTWNPYTQSHTAGVLSFEEDIPDDDATRLAEEFIDILLPGRPANGQFLTLFGRHHERSRKRRYRTGIHFFVLHTDLWRNRKCDPYWSARDQRRVEAWQEFVNMREGFSSPKDPHRSRALHVRAWPESPDAAELAAHYERLLKRHPFEPADRDEIACTLALHGASDCAIDRTRAGRLRARFTAPAADGRTVHLSAIASPRKKAEPLHKSALRRFFGAEGFLRTPEVFASLAELVEREITHAAKRQEARHGISQTNLAATLQRVRDARLAIPEFVPVLSVTVRELQVLNPASVFSHPDMSVLTPPVAALEGVAGRSNCRRAVATCPAVAGLTGAHQLAGRPIISTPDETGMGFPTFNLPDLCNLLDLSSPAVALAGPERDPLGRPTPVNSIDGWAPSMCPAI